MQEKQREEKIKRWFDMWLTGERQELSRLFDKNVYYSESWGPEYHGVAQLERWFDDWNRQGQVKQWKILWWNGIFAVSLQARCSSLMELPLSSGVPMKRYSPCGSLAPSVRTHCLTAYKVEKEEKRCLPLSRLEKRTPM